MRQRETERVRQTDRERERQRATERERERQAETETDRQADRQTDRQRAFANHPFQIEGFLSNSFFPSIQFEIDFAIFCNWEERSCT